jgi:hypothetical protein
VFFVHGKEEAPGQRTNRAARFFLSGMASTSSKGKREERVVKRLGKTCIECGSDIVGKTEEKERRLFRFERIDFACGATLESFYTANGNVGRVTHSGCTAAE